jgi:small-conductance mechanosensitive channel
MNQSAERLLHWVREGPELVRVLQAELERLRDELTAVRAEKDALAREQETWEAVVNSVHETTRQVDEMIQKLRGSRRRGA